MKELNIRFHTECGKFLYYSKSIIVDDDAIREISDLYLNEDQEERDFWTNFYREDGLIGPDQVLEKVLPTNISVRDMNTGKFLPWKHLK